MFVKICGTTSWLDAQLAIEGGADALGFIFAPSKRRVTVGEAAAITRRTPVRVERVGVFAEPDPEAIADAVRGARLSAVQMHWPYDGAVVTAVREALGETIKLWQVVGFLVDPDDAEVADREFTFRLRAALHDPRLDVVLLDAVKGQASGGLGQVLPWGRLASILKPARIAAMQAGTERGFTPAQVVLAGGLKAENVGDAMHMLQPWGVDVVSGVEASPGQKSPDRLAAFFDAVRQAP